VPEHLLRDHRHPIEDLAHVENARQGREEIVEHQQVVRTARAALPARPAFVRDRW